MKTLKVWALCRHLGHAPILIKIFFSDPDPCMHNKQCGASRVIFSIVSRGAKMSTTVLVLFNWALLIVF